MATVTVTVSDTFSASDAHVHSRLSFDTVISTVAFTDAAFDNQSNSIGLSDVFTCTDGASANAVFSNALLDATALTDTASLVRSVQELLAESASLSDAVAAGQVLLVAVTDGVTVGLALVGDEDLDVWVVNAKTGASSRYERYAFNAMATLRGVPFGATRDGIYRLDKKGSVDAYINLGKRSFGSTRRKRIPAVWLGVKSEKPLILRVRDDQGKLWTYRAAQATPHMAESVITPGKGLKMVYWELELLSDEGASFELDSVELEIALLDRKAH